MGLRPRMPNEGRMSMNRRVRFLTWYRVIPLLVVLVFGVISYAYSFGPSLLFKAWYPLKYEEKITEASNRYGLDPYLVAAIIRTESGWDPEAVSERGAQGLMQLMPDTAADIANKGYVDGYSYPADDLLDPDTNIEYGCAYFSFLLSYFNGATDKAIAAYNAGMGNVDSWMEQGDVLQTVIAFPETQAYLVRVNMAQSRYRELYPGAFD